MKKYILINLIAIICSFLSAQNTQYKKPDIKSSVFDFVEKIKMPDSLKKESLIVLGSYNFIEYQNYINQIGVNIYSVVRVKANDKTGLEKISTLYLDDLDPNNNRITVYKKNGDTINLDIRKLGIKSEIETNFYSDFSFSQNNYRIAIPNLEIEDEVEFGSINSYTKNINIKGNKIARVNNQALLFVLSSGYLVPFITKTNANSNEIEFKNNLDSRIFKKYQIIHTLNRKYVIKNNAIKFNLVLDAFCNEEDKNFEYEIIDNNTILIESKNTKPFKNEYFQVKEKENPYFKVYLKVIKTKNTYDAFAKKQIILEKDAKNLVETFEKSKWLANKQNIVFNFIKFKKLSKLKKMNPEEVLSAFYFYLKKDYILGRKYFNSDYAEAYKDGLYVSTVTSFLLKKLKIPYKWLVYESVSVGNFYKVSNKLSFYYAIEVTSNNKNLFIGDLNKSTRLSVLPKSFYGAKGVEVDGYTYQVEKRDFKPNIENINKFESYTKTILNKDSTNLRFKSDFEYQGINSLNFSLDELNNKVYKNFLTSYGLKKLDTKKVDNYELNSELNFKTYFKNNNWSEADKRDENNRLNLVFKKVKKEKLKDEFNAEVNNILNQKTKLHEYTILNDGAEQFNNNKAEDIVSFNADYTQYNVVQKLENNMLALKIGYLIKDQLNINDKEDIERESKIQISYPETISCKLEIELPKNSKVLNVNEFNSSAKHNLVDVFFTLKESNNVLTFEFSKIYKGNVGEKTEWTDFKKVLDLASELSEKKLLIQLN